MRQMNILIAGHLLFVALGLGGAAGLYAVANSGGREEARKVAWAGLIGAMVTGPVYALSSPRLIDEIILAKAGIGIVLVVLLYWLTNGMEDMDAGKRSTALLGVLIVWLIVFFLGIQAAHP